MYQLVDALEQYGNPRRAAARAIVQIWNSTAEELIMLGCKPLPKDTGSLAVHLWEIARDSGYTKHELVQLVDEL